MASIYSYQFFKGISEAFEKVTGIHVPEEVTAFVFLVVLAIIIILFVLKPIVKNHKWRKKQLDDILFIVSSKHIIEMGDSEDIQYLRNLSKGYIPNTSIKKVRVYCDEGNGGTTGANYPVDFNTFYERNILY